MSIYSNNAVASQAVSSPELDADDSYTHSETGQEVPYLNEVPESATDDILDQDVGEHDSVTDEAGKPLKHTMLEDALNFLGQYDDIAKAVAAHGAENFGKTLMAIGDPMLIATLLKKTMAQVTKGVYWQFVKAQNAQNRLARMAGGGVNGFELSFHDFFTGTDANPKDYPANEGGASTPAEMYTCLEQVYIDLSTPFAQLASSLGWDTTLPYMSKETAGGWVTAIDVSQAFQFLDDDRASRAKAKELKTASVVANLANLTF